MTVLDHLPATSPELAAIFEVSVRTINARLQHFARKKKARRSDRAVRPLERHRGAYPHIWERI